MKFIRIDTKLLGKFYPNTSCFVAGTANASDLTTTGLTANEGSLCFTEAEGIYLKYGPLDIDWEMIRQNDVDMMYSGFISWTGAGDYWSRTGNQFTVLRGGTGRISTTFKRWNGNQTVTLVANETNYVYVDGDGVVNTTTAIGSLYTSSIMLFEVLYDGTNAIVVKENHPYSFSGMISLFLHNTMGTVLRAVAGILQKIGTGTGAVPADRQIKFTGGDTLEDHGLSTYLPETSPITWTRMYKNASGKWAVYDTVTELTAHYVLNGVVTASVNKRSCLYSLYVGKDNLNSTTPLYVALFDDIAHFNLAAAQTAISGGLWTRPDNELRGLELAQIGFTSIRLDGTNSVEWISTEKDTAGLRIAQIGSAGSHILTSDINGGQYGDGGHSNLVGKVEASSDPVPTDDVTNYKNLTMWKNSSHEISMLMDNTDESAKWHKLTQRVRDWGASTWYVKGEMVRWNGACWRVNATHTSGASFDLSQVDVLEGFKVDSTGRNVLEVVYWDGDSWELARSDAEGTLSEPVMVTVTVAGSWAWITGKGRRTITGHGLTGTQYLSGTVSGGLTGTKPTTGYVQTILKVVDANTVDILDTEAIEV